MVDDAPQEEPKAEPTPKPKEPDKVIVVKTWSCAAARPGHPISVPRGSPCPLCGRSLLEG